MCSTNVVDRVTVTANGKRQIQVKNFYKNRERAAENSSRHFKWVKLVKVMKSKRRVKGKHGHTLQIHVCGLQKSDSKPLYSNKVAYLFVGLGAPN